MAIIGNHGKIDMGIKTIKQANENVGGLSNPSKMPGYCISLPADNCNVGSKLRKVKGSVCENCYGCKGRYAFPATQSAQNRRLDKLTSAQWIDSMVFLINKRANKTPEFRWHDCGDIQGLTHLVNICKVAEMTPSVKHWLPTKEYAVVRKYRKLHGNFPSNLCVRVSMPMIGQKPSTNFGLPTSTVDSGAGFHCPVQNGEQTCNTYNCRACWDDSVNNIDYGKH